MVKVIENEEGINRTEERTSGIVNLEKLEIIRQVQEKYSINLEPPFVHVYENSFDLYVRHFLNECETRADFIEVIKGFVVEGAQLEDTVLDDDNVFVLGEIWIYCDTWEDAGEF